ncbi:hypothetical protein TNCV_1326241 [Trichonephila clavipes]|nr:hypothetical protein TNCV_1326241 [Trichonephila clavipes]
MTTTTGEKTFQASDKSSNGRVQHVRMYGGYFSADRIFPVPTDLMDRIDYTRDFKYPHSQKSAGVKSGEPRRPWVPAALCARFISSSESSVSYRRKTLTRVSSVTGLLHPA